LGDDHIHELWWEPDFWQHADLMTHETKPPYADGGASGYVIYDADLGTQHAVYEAEGGIIQRISWLDPVGFVIPY
jgi:hypothetical protein